MEGRKSDPQTSEAIPQAAPGKRLRNATIVGALLTVAGAVAAAIVVATPSYIALLKNSAKPPFPVETVTQTVHPLAPPSAPPTKTSRDEYAIQYVGEVVNLPRPDRTTVATVDFEAEHPRADPDDGNPDRHEVDMRYARNSTGYSPGITVVHGGMGRVTTDYPSFDECDQAATSRPLPALTEAAITTGSPLKVGDSLCLNTTDENLVHLRVLDISGRKGDLKSYIFSATLWDRLPEPN